MLDKTRMLIKGGTVVLGHAVSQQNVFIQGEKIVDVGDLSDIKDVYKIDATGLLLLPEARWGMDNTCIANSIFFNNSG
ncbi:MAG: hypothetical protein WBF32_11815 [Candidatus Aminicenantaceae bacterium]